MSSNTTDICITVQGTEVCLQGQGDEVILMLHGWPDTRALWDGTVVALQDRATCARLTLPGFETGPSATSLDDMCRDAWNWQRKNPQGFA